MFVVIYTYKDWESGVYMLFYDNLYDVIFTSHTRHIADEIIIISGYIGPKPIEALKNLPLKATVIYGMYGEQGISNVLYSQLDEISRNDDDLTIFCTNGWNIAE